MKNIFRFLMAVAVLFTASCAKEDISSSIGGGEVEMTFTVYLPELGTRAYGDGTKANTLRYYVYDGDNYLPLISSESLPNKKVALVDGKATVTLPLLKGMIYNIVFWADKDGCYSINTDYKTVTVDYTGAYANDDNRDAFYKHLTNVDPTDAVEIKKQANVTLTRPFGQLNAATSDFDAVEKNEVDLTTSALTVTANTTLDLTTGFGSNPQTFSFVATAIPTETETLPNKTGYKYLSMNYLLPGNVNAEYSFNAKKGGQDFTFTGTSYTNVPIKANYRTNILGALLTKPTAFNVEILPGFGGEEVYDVEDIHVATAQQLLEAVETVAATGGEVVLVDDIELSDILVITSPSTRAANAEGKVIILDGNGKKLISTAGRAINVSGVENVTIKNLTIECSGERAINIIQNATNVTIDNVTATAANYTVNVAASAPNAVVAIKNSTLNGLCTVNVSAADAQVTVDNCTVNCNDNNTTAGEAYAALSLNKEAVGGSIIATNTTVNVTDGSDSHKGRNGAEDGTVTINGSTEGVVTMVTAITYPDSAYYYAFATLEAAIEFAKVGDTILLLRDITLTETLVIPADKNISLDLNGKTLAHQKVETNYALNNHGTLTIKGNGTVNARGIYNGYDADGNYVATAKLIIENGTFNAKGTNGGAAVYNYGIVEVNGGKFESNGGYGLNNQAGGILSVNDATVKGGIYNVGTLAINNSTIYQHLSGKHAIYNWTGSVTIQGGEFDSLSGNELILADGQDASVVINGGTFNKTAKSWLFGAATGKNISFVINGGTHNGYVNKPEMSVDTIRPYGDPIVVTGGTFNFNPTKWLAEGYKAVEVDGKYVVVSENINVASTPIVNKEGSTYEGEFFENPIQNALIFQNWIFSGDATIKVENKTYGAIILDTVTGSINGNAIEINNDNNSVMILQNVDLTLAEGKKLIKSTKTIYQVFMSNITINGVPQTQESIAQYLENVGWYEVVEEI